MGGAPVTIAKPMAIARPKGAPMDASALIAERETL